MCTRMHIVVFMFVILMTLITDIVMFATVCIIIIYLNEYKIEFQPREKACIHYVSDEE